MPRNRGTIDFEEEEDDDFDDREDPESYDQDADDEPDDCTCPHCGASVYESAEICPKCHSYIIYHEVLGMKQRRWVKWVTMLLLAAIATGIFGMFHFR